jgi:hypothetical protein
MFHVPSFILCVPFLHWNTFPLDYFPLDYTVGNKWANYCFWCLVGSEKQMGQLSLHMVLTTDTGHQHKGFSPVDSLTAQHDISCSVTSGTDSLLSDLFSGIIKKSQCRILWSIKFRSQSKITELIGPWLLSKHISFFANPWYFCSFPHSSLCLYHCTQSERRHTTGLDCIPTHKMREFFKKCSQMFKIVKFLLKLLIVQHTCNRVL